MLYHWLGWISFAMCVLLLAKYIGRISKCKNINNSLRRLHKPFGIAVIVIGVVHGLLSFIKCSQEVVANLSGIFLWALIALLAVTFYSRKKLKSKWFALHRFLAVLLVASLVIHVAVVL